MSAQAAFEAVYRPSKIVPRTRSSDTSMKVLALGLGRSGTDSLRTALEELGYAAPYHGWQTAGEGGTGDAVQWCRLLVRKYCTTQQDGSGCRITAEDFDAILGGSEAVTDLPCAVFARELLAAYPNAKVIINTRPDVDKWYESMEQTFCAIQDDWQNWYQSLMVTEAFWVRRLWYDLMFNFFFHGDIRRTAKWRYGEHVAMVRGLCQDREVLEWSVTDGWEPLCKFLAKPVPDRPFPSGNASPELMRRVQELHVRMGSAANRNAAVLVAILVGILCLLVGAWSTL